MDSDDFSFFSRNEPLHLLLHALSLSDEEDDFLRNLVLTEEMFPWFNIDPLTFFNGNDSRWRATRFSSLWFCFCLRSACKIFCTQFRAYSSSWSSGISVSLLFKFITNLIHEKFCSRSECCLCSKTLILISTPCLPCKLPVVTSSTGPILVFPWIDPFFCDVDSSLGKVFSRQATAFVLNNTQKSLHPYKIH